MLPQMRAWAPWLRIVVACCVVLTIASTSASAASIGAPVVAAQACIMGGGDAGRPIVERRHCRAVAAASAPAAEPEQQREWRARATRPHARVLPRVLVDRPYLRNCVLLR